MAVQILQLSLSGGDEEYQAIAILPSGCIQTPPPGREDFSVLLKGCNQRSQPWEINRKLAHDS